MTELSCLIPLQYKIWIQNQSTTIRVVEITPAGCSLLVWVLVVWNLQIFLCGVDIGSSNRFWALVLQLFGGETYIISWQILGGSWVIFGGCEEVVLGSTDWYNRWWLLILSSTVTHFIRVGSAHYVIKTHHSRYTEVTQWVDLCSSSQILMLPQNSWTELLRSCYRIKICITNVFAFMLYSILDYKLWVEII
jgi:hypothetical protein